MKRNEKIFQHVANGLAIGSGIAYAWTRYFPAPESDAFTQLNPWETLFLKAHLLVVPILVFALGVVWNGHALRMFLSGKNQSRRPTGLSLLAAATPMVLSGYLIQVVSSEGWRTTWIALHLATSALWSLAYAWHLATPVRIERPDPRPE
jgi:hypothetical protein